MYYLLPFRFDRIDNNEILVNEVGGDFLITPVGTAKRIAHKEIRTNEELYKDMISSFLSLKHRSRI